MLASIQPRLLIWPICISCDTRIRQKVNAVSVSTNRFATLRRVLCNKRMEVQADPWAAGHPRTRLLQVLMLNSCLTHAQLYAHAVLNCNAHAQL